ncbi:hypothetical protein ACH4C6_21645 [Streptomyces sp. NPDC017943]|uniref:hypothetical protein n=1 Tax=Streptomyces sp. NPDC017943 TaxID=3365019 RepID=UPI003799F08A
MGRYERLNEDHEVVETVLTVDGSPRDQQLAASATGSKVWRRAEGDGEQAPAAEPKRRPAAQPKPPVKEA